MPRHTHSRPRAYPHTADTHEHTRARAQPHACALALANGPARPHHVTTRVHVSHFQHMPPRAYACVHDYPQEHAHTMYAYHRPVKLQKTWMNTHAPCTHRNAPCMQTCVHDHTHSHVHMRTTFVQSHAHHTRCICTHVHHACTNRPHRCISCIRPRACLLVQPVKR